MKLLGKVAIITGAAQGIGEAIASMFAREGASVVIGDIVIEKAEKVAEAIRNGGGAATAIKVDVANRRDVQNLVNGTLGQFKKIDILVNNAGVLREAAFVEATDEDWDPVIDVNLKGAFYCTQAVLPHMMAHRYGKIINMSSVAALGASDERMASYSVSKAGIIELTRVTAREAGEYGINVNAIAPGTVATELTYRRGKDTEKHLEARKMQTVLRRVGKPEDIANLTLFLACDDSSFITGQVIRCDGGRTDRL